jgi:hypothetical protein
MPKNTGILRIEGTLQDMTFYKTQDGHLVKTKSGVSGDRIAMMLRLCVPVRTGPGKVESFVFKRRVYRICHFVFYISFQAPVLPVK